MRYKNWKLYFAMVSDAPAGFISGVLPYHWAQVVNIKRDPFETSIGEQIKTLTGEGGALAAPSTAYVYDWNLLPIGQALWLKELETYIPFPPMQDPATYNLTQVMQQVQEDEDGRPLGIARPGLGGRPWRGARLPSMRHKPHKPARAQPRSRAWLASACARPGDARRLSISIHAATEPEKRPC